MSKHPLLARLPDDAAEYDGIRVTQFHSCRITVGQLRALCMPHVGKQGAVAELAMLKLRSVREFPDAFAVVLTVEQVEALGGTVGLLVTQKPQRPHRVVRAAMVAPVVTEAGELKHLCAVTRHRRADLLYDQLAKLDDKAPVPLEGEFLEQLTKKAPATKTAKSTKKAA